MVFRNADQRRVPEDASHTLKVAGLAVHGGGCLRNADGKQVALAWLLHRSPNILLIPGTSSLTHLRENLSAGALTLSPQILAELDGIAVGAPKH